MTDNAIAKEIGRGIRAQRLRKNITQQALSQATLLSLNTIKALEVGKGKLLSLIIVLRELDALDQLRHFTPEVSISPLQLAKMQGRVRQRASKTQPDDPVEDDASW